MIPAIKANKLTKWYKKGVSGHRLEALAGLTFTVQQGEVFGFIGANGAGKSTTIKILMGLITPSQGDAYLLDTLVSDPLARARVGYLSEHPQFYDYLTPYELFRLVGAARRMATKLVRQRTEELLSLVSLSGSADRKIRGFSKGMVQRLGLAMALLGDPDLLILDEPMSGLDPLGRHLVATIIREQQKQGKTIFFSTHIIPDIETLCDRVGILVRGHQKYVGSIQEALYPAGNRFELTVRMPEEWHPEPTVLGRQRLLWHKETLHKFEIVEDMIPGCVQTVASGHGSIVMLEPKRRSLEELFLELSSRAGEMEDGSKDFTGTAR